MQTKWILHLHNYLGAFALQLSWHSSLQEEAKKFMSTNLLLQGKSKTTTAEAYHPFAPSAASVTPLLGVFVASNDSTISVSSFPVTFWFIQLLSTEVSLLGIDK